ncbi:MAG: tyrosine-protein phosphatase [Polyangiales bacterium]
MRHEAHHLGVTLARRACASVVVPLTLAAAFLVLPVSLLAQGIAPSPAVRRLRRGAWPELPPGNACPRTATALPGRGNFLSIRKFSPVGPLEGCSARWNDGLHRQFFRGSPPSRRGIECLGTTFGVTHMIDLRRPDEILSDSQMGGFHTEEEALADFGRRHPDHPIRYLNVRTSRTQPRENQTQIENVVRYVQDVLREDPAAVFYLHCRAGRDRTGVMIAAIASVVGECPWPAVRRQLYAYRFSRSYARPLLYPLQHAIGLPP